MSAKILAKSSPLEKLIYGLGDVGTNLCWTFMSMYVTMYYTDSVGISAAVAGTIMLVARVFDGISDVLGAMLIEKCHFKMGKIRPWFLIASPLLGISLFASFHVPAAWDSQAKVIYVFMTYTFTAAVSYTIYNLAYSAILTVMALDEHDRSTAATIGRFVTTGGVTVMFYVTPILLAMWGGGQSQSAWSRLSTVYALLCTILVCCMGLFIKEKSYEVENDGKGEENKPAQKGELSKAFKAVLTTKYTWLLLGLFLLFYLYSGVSSIKTYYYKDVLGDLGLFSMGSMLASLPQLFALLLVPALFKMVERGKAVIAGCVIFILSNIAFAMFSRSVAAAYICTVIMSLAWTPLTAVIYVYIADLVDYIYRKKHVRVEAAASMASSIGTKIGAGLGSAAVGWGLALINYGASLEVQTAATQRGIVGLTCILPMILGVLIMVIMLFWKVDQEKEEN